MTTMNHNKSTSIDAGSAMTMTKQPIEKSRWPHVRDFFLKGGDTNLALNAQDPSYGAAAATPDNIALAVPTMPEKRGGKNIASILAVADGQNDRSGNMATRTQRQAPSSQPRGGPSIPQSLDASIHSIASEVTWMTYRDEIVREDFFRQVNELHAKQMLGQSQTSQKSASGEKSAARGGAGTGRRKTTTKAHSNVEISPTNEKALSRSQTPEFRRSWTNVNSEQQHDDDAHRLNSNRKINHRSSMIAERAIANTSSHYSEKSHASPKKERVRKIEPGNQNMTANQLVQQTSLVLSNEQSQQLEQDLPPVQPSKQQQQTLPKKTDHIMEIIDLKLQIANQQATIDTLSSQSKKTEMAKNNLIAELESYKKKESELKKQLELVQESALRASLGSSPIKSTNLSHRDTINSASTEEISNQSIDNINNINASTQDMQTLLTKNIALTSENARLQQELHDLRKYFQDHVQCMNEKQAQDKEILAKLQDHVKRSESERRSLDPHKNDNPPVAIPTRVPSIKMSSWKEDGCQNENVLNDDEAGGDLFTKYQHVRKASRDENSNSNAQSITSGGADSSRTPLHRSDESSRDPQGGRHNFDIGSTTALSFSTSSRRLSLPERMNADSIKRISSGISNAFQGWVTTGLDEEVDATHGIKRSDGENKNGSCSSQEQGSKEDDGCNMSSNPPFIEGDDDSSNGSPSAMKSWFRSRRSSC